ncbi:hypothetical protein FHW36_10645 [Chitinophaga polysaccharea]|uniref:Lipocalin-like domain-containing protein n=1 Tax=Chitinophaga polysaccharea TaxID=1293035 RepID=A0A561PL37_9BACT|nr:hypothetical protein [Chitinophaga polysaccharea]TWF38824.1 hypothetical protein FHW36_10645 [Chitinophaga polysaccharea]
MKKAFILPVLLIISCSQEMVTPDPSVDPIVPTLIGKWNSSKSIYIETTYNGTAIISNDTTVSNNDSGYVQFNKDSIYYTYVPNNHGTGQYRDTGVFTLNRNQVETTSTIDGQRALFNINELSGSVLKISYIDTTLIPNGIFITKGFLEYNK